VDSEEWVAIAEDKGEIAIGAKVVVLDIDGNKLVVRKDS
jgi:membrane protein implicated in regulation of membrane protease activity